MQLSGKVWKSRCKSNRYRQSDYGPLFNISCWVFIYYISFIVCVCVWDGGLQGDLIFCKRAFLCRCRRRRLALRFLFFSPRDGGDEMTNGPFFCCCSFGFLSLVVADVFKLLRRDGESQDGRAQALLSEYNNVVGSGKSLLNPRKWTSLTENDFLCRCTDWNGRRVRLCHKGHLQYFLFFFFFLLLLVCVCVRACCCFVWLFFFFLVHLRFLCCYTSLWTPRRLL